MWTCRSALILEPLILTNASNDYFLTGAQTLITAPPTVEPD
jgi:hypothetical protein